MTFDRVIQAYSWEQEHHSILAKTSADVEKAIYKSRTGRFLDTEDFKALISPQAVSCLEQMAQLSHLLTQRRFGKAIQLYTPMYLSNECQNICNYCGFSLQNKIDRKTLNDDEMVREAKIIKGLGYDHILLVSGEANSKVGMPYFIHALNLIRPFFSNISMEVQPLSTQEYKTLIKHGVNSVFIYQETYHRKNYNLHHIKGRKANYKFRIETPDRLGRAGIYKIGIGVLLGLEDWRTDSLFCAMHLKYLEKKYWTTKFSISFPRLRPYSETMETVYPDGMNLPSDRDLVQLICAYRLFDQDVELSLSTRESETFRNHAIKIGITNISADSKTSPGGHQNKEKALKQFEIADRRSGKKLKDVIASAGYETVWKDWDRAYN